MRPSSMPEHSPGTGATTTSQPRCTVASNWRGRYYCARRPLASANACNAGAMQRISGAIPASTVAMGHLSVDRGVLSAAALAFTTFGCNPLYSSCGDHKPASLKAGASMDGSVTYAYMTAAIQLVGNLLKTGLRSLHHDSGQTCEMLRLQCW